MAKQLRKWSGGEGEGGEGATYYDQLAADADVVKVVLLLTGGIEGMKAQTVEYLSERRTRWRAWLDGGAAVECPADQPQPGCLVPSQLAPRLILTPNGCCAPALLSRSPAHPEAFSAHEFLWKTDLAAEHAAFLAGAPSLEDVEAQLRRMNAVEQARTAGAGLLRGLGPRRAGGSRGRLWDSSAWLPAPCRCLQPAG